MGRSRIGGGGCFRAKSPSRFGLHLRRHVKLVLKKDKHASVDQLVDHLRSTYRQYSRLELRPFTKHVHQILHSLRKENEGFSEDSNSHEQKEASPRKKRKELDMSEETRVKKRGIDVGFGQCNGFSSSSASSSSSSVGSSEDEVTTSESNGRDLMKSMIREKYGAKSKTSAEKRGVVEKGLDKTVSLVEQKRRNGLGAFNNDKTRAGPKFKDFGGMSEVINQLQVDVILAIHRPEVHRELGTKPITGILLHGPPGCGKTMLAQVIANEAGVPFYNICATELVSGVSGGSEENIRELFSKAHRTAPSIVFIDEIDAIASVRGTSQREMEIRVVTQLMSCMDEAAKPVDRNEDSESSDSRSGYVLVIGATNRPDAIEPALRRPGRFDREIGFGFPDEETRIQILTKLTRNCNLKVDADLDLKKVVRSTSGFVGADLAAVTNEAGSVAANRIVNQRKDIMSIEDHEHWWVDPWSPEELKELCITMADFEAATKMVQPSSKREGFSALPNVTWDDVGGLHSLREELEINIVDQIKYPEDCEEFGIDLETGFLLYGPPGCGKTLIAKAVANEAGANFIHIKGPELLNKYVGESESAVRAIFSRARICSPCIIFFDEVDALATDRHTERGGVQVLNQLLVLLAESEQRRGIYVIGATNRPEVLDPALLRPGRFAELFYVPLPSPEERGLILRALARNKKIDPTVDLMALGKECENFSGADLAALMKQAAAAAMRDKRAAMKDKRASPQGSSVDDSLRTIKNEHFNRALEKVSPSVSEKQIRHYERLSKRFRSGSG